MSAAKPRGFAAMSAEKRRAIAIKGGKAVPDERRAFSQNRALAAAAGSKGGKAPKAGKRKSFLRRGAAPNEEVNA